MIRDRMLPIWILLLSGAMGGTPVFGEVTQEKLRFTAHGKPQEAFIVSGKSPWSALIPDLTGYPATGSQVSEMASRFQMVAAVNANFYKETKDDLFEPIGLVVSKGRLFSFPHQHFPSVGFINGHLEWGFLTADAFFQMGPNSPKYTICRLNAPATKACAALWTTPPPSVVTRGIALRGDGLAPKLGSHELPIISAASKDRERWFLEFPVGDEPSTQLKLKGVTMAFHLKAEGSPNVPWNQVSEAVSGSHVCVFKNKSVQVLPKKDRPWAASPQPRTMVGGVGSDGKAASFAAVIDGRRTDSQGVSVEQACLFLHEKFKSPWIVNLDGGGSSVLVYKGKVQNTPANGLPRPVAVGWGVR